MPADWQLAELFIASLLIGSRNFKEKYTRRFWFCRYRPKISLMDRCPIAMNEERNKRSMPTHILWVVSVSDWWLLPVRHDPSQRQSEIFENGAVFFVYYSEGRRAAIKSMRHDARVIVIKRPLTTRPVESETVVCRKCSVKSQTVGLAVTWCPYKISN